MVLAKTTIPEEKYIVTQNNFVVNTIYMIGIRKIDTNSFLLLFITHQDYDNAVMYLQVALVTDNEFEHTFFNDHELRLENLKKDEDKVETYRDLLQSISADNIFSCDMNMKEDPTHPGYYLTKAVRNVDNTHYSIMNCYFTLHNFVRIYCYLNMINTRAFSSEKIFTDKELNFIKLYNIEYIKLDATCCTNQYDENDAEYNSHYTMNCGPKEFRFNFSFLMNQEIGFDLKIPLDKSIYDANYSQDPIIYHYFLNDNKLYLLHYKKSEESFEYSLLCIPVEIAAKKTNFLDLTFIFEKGEDDYEKINAEDNV